MRLLISTVLLALAACQLGCKSPASITRASPLPGDTAQEVATGLAGEHLTQAAKLYVTKCARCHKLYSPTAYSDAEWRGWVIKMTKKARLTADQQEMLIGYGQSVRP